MHKVKEIKTQVRGQELDIFLPNEMAIFTLNGKWNRWYLDLPVLGQLQQRNERMEFVRTLKGWSIMMTIFAAIGALVGFVQKDMKFAGICLAGIAALWAFVGFCKLWEDFFYTKLTLGPNQFQISQRGLLGETVLTKGRLEGALDLEVERAYHSIEHELGGKKRCNLYIHDGGRRMRIARGLDESLCIQTANRIERYVNRALPPGES